MVNSNSKGARKERELVSRLDDAGFAVIRAPASGAATERELPDVLAGNVTVFVAVEAKASAGDPIYLTAEEVEALVYFAANFGAEPLIGARFNREPWYFLPPWACHCTPSGKSYRVTKELAKSEGTRLSELESGGWLNN